MRLLDQLQRCLALTISTAMSLFPAPLLASGPSCRSIFSFETVPALRWQSAVYTLRGGREVPYLVAVDPVVDGFARLQSSTILPEVSSDRRLIIGFHGGHTYLQYKNVRIDSQGMAGVRVTSMKKSSQIVYGDMAFVIGELPPATLQRLDQMVTDFQVQSKLTCTQVACSYLSEAEPGIASARTLRTSSLIRSLLEEKVQGARQIEVLSLSGRSLEEVLHEVQGLERHISITSAVMIFTVVALGGQLIAGARIGDGGEPAVEENP